MSYISRIQKSKEKQFYNIKYTEIIINELTENNNWLELSNIAKFDFKTMKEFKDKIFWTRYVYNHPLEFKYFFILNFKEARNLLDYQLDYILPLIEFIIFITIILIAKTIFENIHLILNIFLL